MTTAQFLLNVLDELTESDFLRFKFYLQDSTEFKPIASGLLEGKSRLEMVFLLQKHYAEEARDISRKILLKIPRRDLVENMYGQGVTSGAEGRAEEVKPKLLTDKELMTLAKNMGHNWKQIGIQFLDLQSYEIEQCEVQHRTVVLQSFEMFKCWRNREKEGATALKLHSILANKDCPISSEHFDCLLDKNH
ncbi:uncharacterized protein LOC121273169 isoform X2 [Carcharodon carcharias]|uniref:uncharacterized protein LOC121273169 isoform X2 n=1 Tax=Carcharodon carcharias TaxID=13397 RepID=UPI001B7E9574|nr:uncharacterized protein LOC121273169 isoform X2 [Carcharodon carcharias]